MSMIVAGSSIRRWLRRPAIVPLARFFVVLVCLSLVASDGWLMWTARRVKLHEAEIETSNLASALARQAFDSLKKADSVLLDLVERLQMDGRDLQRLQRVMSKHVQEQGEMHGLFVYDRDGNWLVNSYGEQPPEASNADREYFIFHRQHPDDHDAHVGLPVRSRTTGEWVIPLSRRLEDAQGHFAGVVVATISTDYFRHFYATFDVREGGSITLVHNDGSLLMRIPFRDELIGTSIAGGKIFSRMLPESPTGTALLPSPFDGVERLYSYRTLQGYPMVVITAMSKDSILADWRADAARQLLVVSLLATLLGLFGFYLLRLIKVGQRNEVELRATRDALRALNKRLEQQALEDELTRLANRRRLMLALNDEYQRAMRTGRPLALVLFDVDHFKQYNDIYGHSAGDECLRTVAGLIRAGQQRPADLAARYGGEEFCLLLPETDAQGALQVAERIRQTLENRALPHQGSPRQRMSLSAGVNVCQPQPNDAEGIDTLIQGADKALYAAKAAGRDRVMLFPQGA